MPYKTNEERNEHYRQKRINDPEWHRKKKEAQRQWYLKNAERVRAENKAKWHTLTPEQKLAESRRYKPKRLANSIARLEAKAGRPRPDHCELCGKPSDHRWGKVVFDHDHVSGAFRGWLCNKCNRIFGYVADDPDLLEKMATYLRNGGVK